MEFKIGAGLACVGIAVGLGQWLIPPDTINPEVRLVLVLIAFAFGLSGIAVLLHAAWKYFLTDHGKSGGTSAIANKGKDAAKGSNKTFDVYPVEGYTSIYEASARFYEDFPRKFILERARQELELDPRFISNDSKAERLKLAAKYITAKIPIHGKDSSNVLRRVGNMNNMVFNEDLTCLEHIFYPGSSGGKYTEIAVKSDEFDAFLGAEAMHQGFQEELPRD